MSWTDEDEAAFNAALTKRKAHEKDIGTKAFVESLRSLADDIEKGRSVGSNVSIRFLRREVFGYPDSLPYAKEITIYIPIGE